MRVLLGLAALASIVNAQTVTLYLGPSNQQNNVIATAAQQAGGGTTCAATIFAYVGGATTASQPVSANQVGPSTTAVVGGAQLTRAAPQTGADLVNSGSPQIVNGNWFYTVASTVTTMTFSFQTNAYVAQMQYKFSPSNTWLCDPCTTNNVATTAGLASTCDTTLGPSNTGTQSPTINDYNGYKCASFTRLLVYSGLVTGNNKLFVNVYDDNITVDNVSYSFTIAKTAPPIVGDPQIYGLQGQGFQVHGIPDEIFNLITYPNLQVNARFVYLSSAECNDNFTACFAHPGTYIGEEGIRLGNDKIHVKAGSFKKGLTVSVNGQRINGHQSLKLGSVNIMSHRRVVVQTPIVTLTISNSDKFLNQESSLHDKKLLKLGASRIVLADGEQFHPEVPLHGLQGQTWRNVEYPSGLEYEGSINDYHVADGNLFGTDFIFNQFKL